MQGTSVFFTLTGEKITQKKKKSPPVWFIAVKFAMGRRQREITLPHRLHRLTGSGRGLVPRAALTWSSGMPRSWLSGCRQVEPVVR